MDELTQRLMEVSSALQLDIVDTAIRECRKRLQACVLACGGHIKHISKMAYDN